MDETSESMKNEQQAQAAQENEITVPSPGVESTPFTATSTEEAVGEATETVSEEMPPKEESRFRKFLRRLIRLLASILLIFGLGFLTAIYVFYQPKANELTATTKQLEEARAEIESLNSEIDELNDEIARLKSLEDTNKELKATIDNKNLLINLLTARLNVKSALLAIQNDELAQAQTLLETTASVMENIQPTLPAKDRQTFETLQSRLDLALSELETDTYAAQSDLDVLLTGLEELQSSLEP